MDKLNDAHTADVSPEARKEMIDKIDEQGKDCMLHAEKKCRKICSGTIPFSPEASLWIKCCQFYRSLLRFWAGRKKNRGNLKKAARRCKISNPFSLTPEEISMRLRECKNRLKHFKIHSQKYRTQHLQRRLDAAKDAGDDEAEKRILQIISRERNRSFWCRLNWALGTKQGNSVSAVQVDDGEGGVIEYSTQTDIQNALWQEVHQSHYHMAEEAPICQGNLRGLFGYNADTVAARAVLDRKFEFSEEFHKATRWICESVADFRDTILQDSVDLIITREIWQQKWKKKREETSSSVSKLHFGH